MINAKVVGKVMEKVFTEAKNNDGKEKHQLYLFQKGNKNLPVVTVCSKTYDSIKEGQDVEIYCRVGFYSFDNNSGMFATEIF